MATNLQMKEVGTDFNKQDISEYLNVNNGCLCCMNECLEP
jgi:hypothetical protein